MTLNEKIDYTLLALYQQTKDGGMLSIIAGFKQNGQHLDIEELEEIKSILKSARYAVFQVERSDSRGQITDDGISFVEANSFSSPGISILQLVK